MSQPFIPFPFTIQAEMIYEIQNQIVENVLHYHYSLPIDEETLTQLKNALLAWWNTSGKLNATTVMSLTRIKCTDLSSESGPAIDFTVSPTVAGTHAGNPMPLNCAMLLKLTTGLRGRSYRGRMYICGLTEDQVVDNEVDPASLAVLSSRYQGLVAPSAAGFNFQLVIASRFHNGAPRTVGQTVTVVTAALTPEIVTQRRRMPGRGR